MPRRITMSNEAKPMGEDEFMEGDATDDETKEKEYVAQLSEKMEVALATIPALGAPGTQMRRRPGTGAGALLYAMSSSRFLSNQNLFLLSMEAIGPGGVPFELEDIPDRTH